MTPPAATPRSVEAGGALTVVTHSAGLVAWTRHRGADPAGPELRVFLIHMGGPFWARKDAGAWSVPKGIHDADEEPAAAARREFTEEVGVSAPEGGLLDLGTVRSGAKQIRAFAVEADPGLAFRASNTFTLEWPPRSGRTEEFPEADRAEWFGLAQARERIVRSQLPFLDRLAAAVGGPTVERPAQHPGAGSEESGGASRS